MQLPDVVKTVIVIGIGQLFDTPHGIRTLNGMFIGSRNSIRHSVNPGILRAEFRNS